MRLRLAGFRRIVAEARAEGEPFDIGGDDERQTLATRPVVVAPLGQRHIVVAVLLWQQRLQSVISRTYSPPA